ncbi:hypothetical protein [Caenimonas aquaedulcis]|uniref:Uncharacterized protein n=1 Tax=Caenimonas aquaedulcis TaxID=2793270 RepID=A0A931MHN3_9BURK|nr:hypothetical protein [Caenimonas aquaedulcis]MBG9388355.1 hypothetical protein [Caenimonas aquaedulcis]
MQRRQALVDEYHAANQAELVLWEKVQGKGPGQPGFDLALFQQWLEAVGRTNAASKALSEGFADTIPPITRR